MALRSYVQGSWFGPAEKPSSDTPNPATFIFVINASCALAGTKSGLGQAGPGSARPLSAESWDLNTVTASTAFTTVMTGLARREVPAMLV